MKKYSQCLMCKFIFGRTCKLSNTLISDEIYNNVTICNSFKSIQEEELDCEDSCCSETTRYNQSLERD